MINNYIKGYAVLRSKWLSNNILDAYIPFIATIIIEEKMDEVDEIVIKQKLTEKYSISFQLPFIRQILSQAVSKNIIFKCREKFIVNKETINNYKLNLTSFEYDFDLLTEKFIEFSKEYYYFSTKESIQSSIIKFIENYNDHVLFNNISDIQIDDNAFIVCWCNFILELKKNQLPLYEFVFDLCVASLVKNALFYSGELKSSLNLTIYLDTPMIFALLGMDTKERSDAYRYLIQKATSIGISLRIFDQNFEEAKGIMERASKWALSTNYDASKANKVATFFYDSQMDENDINEFIHDFESMLNNMGITKEESAYLAEEDKFQADETDLFNSIKQEYGRRSLKYKSEEVYDNAIQTDVRSLVMIQRKRAGNYSTDFKSARYIFLTTNGIIAKVSKDYALTDELTKDKIPTSITADLFGTLLWLDFPEKTDQYLNLKLIADCKALLKPSPAMIASFNNELDKAYKRGDTDLTEEKFLFLRSHPIVKTFLLDVASGDYAHFSSNSWRDVYERILSNAQYEGELKYKEELADHENTKKELMLAKETIEQKETNVKNLEIENYNQREKFSSDLANIISILIFAIPYIAISIGIIIIQNEQVNWSIKGIVLAGLTIIVGLMVGLLFKKTKKWLKKKFAKHFSNEKSDKK